MVDQGDDNSYVEDFLARAKQRNEKILKIQQQFGEKVGTPSKSLPSPSKSININNNNSVNHKPLTSYTPKLREEVTYPPLSPLEEETDLEPSVCPDDDMSCYDLENKSEMISMDDDQLNYSSDLSIECDQAENELYRAKLVYAESSPERKPTTSTQSIIPSANAVCNQAPNNITLSHISPRKRTHSIPQPIIHSIRQPKIPSISSQESDTTASSEPSEKKTSSHSLPEVNDIEQCIKALKIKVDRADQTRNQLRKAVECSKHGSKEHVEAARLLQIAEIEHLNYTNYMAMYKQGLRMKTDSLGSVKISSLRLKVTTKLRNDLAEDNVSHYFFCIASCGTEVKATAIMNTDDFKCQDLKAYIQFNDKINFPQLQPDFSIKVEVFELVISQPLSKLFLRLTPSKKSKITPESHFRRVGSMKLTLSDRDVKYKNLVQWSKHEESKYIERECKFEMELKPEQLPSKRGKLDIRSLNSSGCLRWDRYFVECSQAQIRFWKSQQDAEDGKKPNEILNLQDLCCESTHKLSPDNNLYRQNSFLIYSYQQVAGGESDNILQKLIKHEPLCKIVKHQLAAQNKEDRDAWCNIIDKSMNCFREWHGKTRVYTSDQIEDIFY